ncbi:hypothetical protein ACFW04_006476 [Cataglyphis niger]
MAQRKNYVEEMLNMSDLPTKDSNDYQSEIPQFFAGCKIFLTGASGFLGILLIEKLLRCCPDIEKIYILMRTKKEKSPEERFKEHFNNPVYDKLKEEQPNFGTKVLMIEGDVGKLDLGLSPENRKLILDTNIIFHGAATVRFNENIRTAVNINVRGTKQMLLLAKEMPNFKVYKRFILFEIHSYDCKNATLITQLLFRLLYIRLPHFLIAYTTLLKKSFILHLLKRIKF